VEQKSYALFNVNAVSKDAISIYMHVTHMTSFMLPHLPTSPAAPKTLFDDSATVD